MCDLGTEFKDGTFLATSNTQGLDLTTAATGIAILFPEWALPPNDYAQVLATRRDELRAELERARELLAHANAIVAPLVDRYLAEYGTSLEALKSQAVIEFGAAADGDEDEPGV